LSNTLFHNDRLFPHSHKITGRESKKRKYLIPGYAFYFILKHSRANGCTHHEQVMQELIGGGKISSSSSSCKLFINLCFDMLDFGNGVNKDMFLFGIKKVNASTQVP